MKKRRPRSICFCILAWLVILSQLATSAAYSDIKTFYKPSEISHKLAVPSIWKPLANEGYAISEDLQFLVLLGTKLLYKNQAKSSSSEYLAYVNTILNNMINGQPALKHLGGIDLESPQWNEDKTELAVTFKFNNNPGRFRITYKSPIRDRNATDVFTIPDGKYKNVFLKDDEYSFEIIDTRPNSSEVESGNARTEPLIGHGFTDIKQREIFAALAKRPKPDAPAISREESASPAETYVKIITIPDFSGLSFKDLIDRAPAIEEYFVKNEGKNGIRSPIIHSDRDEVYKGQNTYNFPDGIEIITKKRNAPCDIYKIIERKKIYGPEGNYEGDLLVYYHIREDLPVNDPLRDNAIIIVLQSADKDKPIVPRGGTTRSEQGWDKAIIKVYLDKDHNRISMINYETPETRQMCLSRTAIGILLKDAGLTGDLEKLHAALKNYLVFPAVTDEARLHEAKDNMPVPLDIISRVNADPSNASIGDIETLEGFAYYKSWTVREKALLSLKAVEKAGRISKNRLAMSEGIFQRFHIEEDMLFIERLLIEDPNLIQNIFSDFYAVHISKNDIEKITVKWLDKGANKNIFLIEFRHKNGRTYSAAVSTVRDNPANPGFEWAAINQALENWERLSKANSPSVPKVFTFDEARDFRPRMTDRAISNIRATENGEPISMDGFIRNDILLVFREFIEGKDLAAILSDPSITTDEKKKMKIAAVQACLDIWNETKDNGGKGLFVGDPKPANVVVSKKDSIYRAKNIDLDLLREFNSFEAVKSLVRHYHEYDDLDIIYENNRARVVGKADMQLAVADKVTILESANINIKRAAEIIGLDPIFLAGDKSLDFAGFFNPERILPVEIPVKRNDGSTRVFYGFRALHNTSRGAGKGGFRFDPHEELAMTEEGRKTAQNKAAGLGSLMTWKNAAVGIPYGGAKGDVIVNKDKLTAAELAQVTPGFVIGLLYQDINAVGPLRDIPAPDMNTGEEEMNEFSATYQAVLRERGIPLTGIETGVVTGKSLENGGSIGRRSATGRGVFFVARDVVAKLGEKYLGRGRTTLMGATIALQGYGNVSSYAAGFFAEDGAIIQAVSNATSAIFNKNGIDIKALDEWIAREKLRIKAKTGIMPREVDLSGFEGATKITNEELLELDVDILVPAAMECQITAKNAPKIRARIIVEGANNPTTPRADKILNEKGILIVPDILANAGGVTVSYYEWIQNITFEKWTAVMVDKMLEHRMGIATENILSISGELGITLREAAYVVAGARVEMAELARNEKLRRHFESQGKDLFRDFNRLKLDPETVESLRLIVEKDKLTELIENSEARQQARIEAVTEMITDKFSKAPEGVKAVFIAGPATIGKTSAQKRIGWLLEHSGKRVKYFNADENSEDYASRLLKGESLEVRDRGDSKVVSFTLKLDDRDILIVEGSRACSSKNLQSVPRERRFEIFGNVVPSMKLEENWPLTSLELRLMREILDVDKRSNKKVLDVINEWIGMRQEQIDEVYDQWKDADVTLDTYLPYEILVMKKYLEGSLREALEESSGIDGKALQLINKLLQLLKGVPEVSAEQLKAIPDNSVMCQLMPDRVLDPAVKIKSSPDQAVPKVKNSMDLVRTHLAEKYENRMDLTHTFVIMRKNLADEATGAKAGILDVTLSGKYQVMKQNVRNFFNNGRDIIEVDTQEGLVAQMNALMAQDPRAKIIVLDDGTLTGDLDPNKNVPGLARGELGKDYCAISTEAVNGLDALSVPFINMEAMAMMGVGILNRDTDRALFEMAYEAFTGSPAPRSLIADINRGILWIIKTLPRIVVFSDETSVSDRLKKLFDAAA